MLQKKKIPLFAVIATLLMMYISNVYAGSTQAGAFVEILPAIVVICDTPVNFGKIGLTRHAHEAALSIAGKMSGDGYYEPNTASTGHCRAIGHPNTVVQISFINGTLKGVGPNMLAHSFVHDQSGTPVLDIDGTIDFNISGRINVGSEAYQTAGNYTGTFEVFLNF